MSPYRGIKYIIENEAVDTDVYIKSRQTIDTTIGSDGLEDNTSPVQSFSVSNVNIIKTENILNV